MFRSPVALHVRAWVEIMSRCYMSRYSMVALHVRAWVEIEYHSLGGNGTVSPSM